MTFEVGNVARAEFRDGSGGEIVLLTVNGWVGTRGPISRQAEAAFNFLPLAVLDPEGGDPDTFYDLYVKVAGVVNHDANRAGMRNALREFIKPVPPIVPKPPEPERLGSTVRDRQDRVWIKVSREGSWAPEGSISITTRWRLYSDIDVVEADVVVRR